MGEIELVAETGNIHIYSNILCYGDEADEQLAQLIGEEIESMWNEPKGQVLLEGKLYTVSFYIHAFLCAGITREDVVRNKNPRNNYFRIEDYSKRHVSYVDGVGSNTGYMKRDNLYVGSTTAAHEYGHTLGLDHPKILDIRGQGRPSIMYPRGTLVDAEFQYDPQAKPGETGGTINPACRRVMPQNIDELRLEEKLLAGKWYVGSFTSVYHEDQEPPPANNA
jgi:hypothetical protein